MNLKIAFAVAAGFVVLPVGLFGGFTTAPSPSTKPWPSGTKGVGPYRPWVTEWKWQWLNPWYSNVEDGVDGQQAWVWENGALVAYASTFPSWMPKWCIALAWSMWRNSANNLKRPLRNDTWAPGA